MPEKEKHRGGGGESGRDKSGGASDGTPSEPVDRAEMPASRTGPVHVITTGQRRRYAVGTWGFDVLSVLPTEGEGGRQPEEC